MDHSQESAHHHHEHASLSRHTAGHHLLQVEDLSIAFSMYDSAAEHYFSAQHLQSQVIHNLHVGVHAGEIVAIVGASGSGKTLLADCLMGLFEPNAIVSGQVWFNGERCDGEALKALRGRGISLVPQSVNYLDPLLKVGRQVQGFTQRSAPLHVALEDAQGTEQLQPGEQPQPRQEPQPQPQLGEQPRQAKLGEQQQPQQEPQTQQAKQSKRAERQLRAKRQRQLFKRYGLDAAVANLYPFELSGGMARRVLLCCALMDDPQVIIADEPTPGLDLELARLALQDFRSFADQGGGVLLITHDIELALSVADRVAVFKEGTVVEETAVANFAQSETLKHPFSKALWHALPEHDFAPQNKSEIVC